MLWGQIHRHYLSPCLLLLATWWTAHTCYRMVMLNRDSSLELLPGKSPFDLFSSDVCSRVGFYKWLWQLELWFQGWMAQLPLLSLGFHQEPWFTGTKQGIIWFSSKASHACWSRLVCGKVLSRRSSSSTTFICSAVTPGPIKTWSPGTQSLSTAQVLFWDTTAQI